MSSSNVTVPSSEKSTTGRPLERREVTVPPALRLGMRTLSALSPALAGRVGRAMFFRPFVTRSRPEWDAVMARGEAFEVVVPHGVARGEAIRGYVFGDGPAVLLAHGWSGHAAQMAGFVRPLVDAGFRVVAFDMPAHGRSSGRVTSLLHFADAIETVCDLYRAEAIVAHSFGAGATMVAMGRRKLFQRIVFIAPPARYDSFWDRFKTGVGLTPAAFDSMRRGAERWLGIEFNELTAEHIAPRLDADLLVMHDTNDREIPVSEGQLVALAWPKALFETTTGLGHLRILHDAGVIERAVGFIRN